MQRPYSTSLLFVTIAMRQHEAATRKTSPSSNIRHDHVTQALTQAVTPKLVPGTGGMALR